MADFEVTVEIKRPPHEVRSWWLDLPDEYAAKDPNEQPHRIVTVAKDARGRTMRTYWRGPWGREILVPERFVYRDHGDWNVEVTLPLGLRQLDEFTLEPTKDGTRVHVRLTVSARRWYGRLTRPFFLAFYAKKSYPRTWRSAARICERDAPVIPLG